MSDALRLYGMSSEELPPGTRVRVQMNGVPDTYEATVVEPSELQLANGWLLWLLVWF